jgi:hypothetical protein
MIVLQKNHTHITSTHSSRDVYKTSNLYDKTNILTYIYIYNLKLIFSHVIKNIMKYKNKMLSLHFFSLQQKGEKNISEFYMDCLKRYRTNLRFSFYEY